MAISGCCRSGTKSIKISNPDSWFISKSSTTHASFSQRQTSSADCTLSVVSTVYWGEQLCNPLAHLSEASQSSSTIRMVSRLFGGRGICHRPFHASAVGPPEAVGILVSNGGSLEVHTEQCQLQPRHRRTPTIKTTAHNESKGMVSQSHRPLNSTVQILGRVFLS